MGRFTAILLLSACSHSDGYLATDPGTSSEPFIDGPIVRLTYEPGMDLFPSWSPDGSRLIYTFQPAGRADRDRCIGILPRDGGTRTEHCYNADDGDRRTDALEWPALGAEGSLLYTQYMSGIGDRIPDRGLLRLGTIDDPFAGISLMTLPATVGTTGFTRIGPTAWTGPGRFVFVAQDYLMLGNIANGNKKDTTYIGLGLVQAIVTPGGAQFSVLPGTDSASTFVISPNADSIYFTRYQDVRLYRVPIAGGARETVFTANVPATGWLVRDPVRLGSRTAIVVARLDQDAQPRGILAGTRMELLTEAMTSSQVVLIVSGGQGIGAIIARPGDCSVVTESRRAQGISWTTDLESRCLGGSTPSCGC
ncbi:MAG: hypothetical protein ABIR59_12525 [Gemmatimonadales bacterium]